MKRKAAGTFTIAKRLKRVERRVARNTPETKLQVFPVTGTVNNGAVSVTELKISGGSSQMYNMEGGKAKLLRVEIVGTLGSQYMDAYLVQGHTTTAPVYADFNPTVGGYIKSEGAATNMNRFTVWKQYLNLGGGNNFRIVQRFKFGYTVTTDTFNNATVKNPLYVVIKNNTGENIAISYSARVWFVDS